MSRYFETRERSDGTEYTTLRDNAPKWVRDAVHEAHCGELPNDWVYAECAAAFLCIADESLTYDSVHAYADGSVDVHTQALAAWYADVCMSRVFADAESEANDSGNDGSISDRIARAQYYAIVRIAGICLEAWERNAE